MVNAGMEKDKSIMGITAMSPKPYWRGFLLLGLIFGAPVLAVLLAIEVVF